MDGKARLLVREIYGENRIEVRAVGSKWVELLSEITLQIDEIHALSKYANLQVNKQVPCPCSGCTTVPNKRHFYNYDFLEKALEKQILYVQCGYTSDSIPLLDIFGTSGIKSPRNQDVKDQVKEMIISGKIDNVKKFLKCHFPNHTEFLIQLARLNILKKEERTGKISTNDYLLETNKIIDGILKTLDQL